MARTVHVSGDDLAKARLKWKWKESGAEKADLTDLKSPVIWNQNGTIWNIVQDWSHDDCKSHLFLSLRMTENARDILMQSSLGGEQFRHFNDKILRLLSVFPSNYVYIMFIDH